MHDKAKLFLISINIFAWTASCMQQRLSMDDGGQQRLYQQQGLDHPSQNANVCNSDSLLKQLFGAVEEGDGIEVYSLIQKGVNVNSRNDQGRTPLHYAAMSGNSVSMRSLIDAGADVNSRDDQGLIPLHCAVGSEDNVLMRILIKAGAGVNIPDNQGKSDLHCAVERGDSVRMKSLIDRMEILIKAGADVNSRDDQGKTPMHCAMGRGDVGSMRTLIAFGANVNIRDDQGKTPLHYAAIQDNTTLVETLTNDSLVETLIKSGADVDIRDNEYATAFHYAAAGFNLKSIECFSNSITAKEINDNSTFDNRFLFAKIAYSLNVSNEPFKHLAYEGYFGFNSKAAFPLYLAAKNNNVPIIQFLLSKGADIELAIIQARRLNDQAAINVLTVYKELESSSAQVNSKKPEKQLGKLLKSVMGRVKDRVVNVFRLNRHNNDEM